MGYVVSLQVNPQSYAQFLTLQQQLNAATKQKLAHELGQLLADVAVQIIQQVFVDLLTQQKQRVQRPEGHKIAEESEKVVQHVLDALKKYLPWSVALLSNTRLVDIVNYFAKCIVLEQDQVFLRYPVTDTLVDQVLTLVQKIQAGDASQISPAFHALTEIIDQGVTHLIRVPKEMLHFNFVVDKTLNGVIQMTTHMGYKRLQGLGKEVDLHVAPYYIDHFLKFLIRDGHTK
ncbi:hypothetical protein F975_00882 [Acinetobacter sp. ANC 3789]|uniref:hypothetical protein n=1 Tax=Acinetobacter sp. ANC 3789 TaxID=1217714 RepID=UPI0002D1120B|nr:hypothetical protein [Acinetobacter sp. ANC 3789]ENU81023.1 hypothetical protein F975_00882 [Acinetobacter sp. ANC 3789]